MRHSLWLIVSLFVFCPATAHSNESSVNQALTSEVVACFVDATNVIEINGTVRVEQIAENIEEKKQDVTLFFSGVRQRESDSGYFHTAATDKEDQKEIAKILDATQNLEKLAATLKKNNLRQSDVSVADFKLFLVSKSKGCVTRMDSAKGSDYFFQEDSTSITGLAIVNFSPEYRLERPGDHHIMLATMRSFKELAERLDCSNIWVTSLMGDHKKMNVVWADNSYAVSK